MHSVIPPPSRWWGGSARVSLDAIALTSLCRADCGGIRYLKQVESRAARSDCERIGHCGTVNQYDISLHVLGCFPVTDLHITLVP
jgi:hypothetical protein